MPYPARLTDDPKATAEVEAFTREMINGVLGPIKYMENKRVVIRTVKKHFGTWSMDDISRVVMPIIDEHNKKRGG